MCRGGAGLRSGRGAVTEVERVAADRRAARGRADASAVTCNGAVPWPGSPSARPSGHSALPLPAGTRTRPGRSTTPTGSPCCWHRRVVNPGVAQDVGGLLARCGGVRRIDGRRTLRSAGDYVAALTKCGFAKMPLASWPVADCRRSSASCTRSPPRCIRYRPRSGTPGCNRPWWMRGLSRRRLCSRSADCSCSCSTAGRCRVDSYRRGVDDGAGRVVHRDVVLDVVVTAGPLDVDPVRAVEVDGIADDAAAGDVEVVDAVVTVAVAEVVAIRERCSRRYTY